jgi:spermidine synthase
MQAATQTARTNPLRLIVILLLVFVSGFANLATEIIGPRMFSSFFGSSTLVWAVMISVTLVGLSVGYYISGRFGLARAKRLLPLILVGNALYLLVVSWAVWQIPAQVGSLGVIAVIVVALLAFFVPSVLFGTTSPTAITLLSENRTQRQMSQIAGTIYALGTFGSVAGALAAAFYLIPFVGLSLSLRIFAFVLVIFALYFSLSARGTAVESSASTKAEASFMTGERRTQLILLFVFFSGFANLATEIIAPRMFASMFGPTTILWAIMISVTLVGLSIGYFIGGQIPLRIARLALPAILIINGALLLAASWLTWELPTMLSPMDVNAMILMAIITFFVPSLLFGMDSQLAITLLAEGKTSSQIAQIVGSVYALSTIGSVVGALLAALFFIPVIGFSTSLKIFAVVMAAFAIYFAPGRARLIAALAAIIAIFVPQPDWRWSDGSLTLLTQREGYYQTIRVYTDNMTFVRFHLGPTYESEMDINTRQPRFGYARSMVELVGDAAGKNILVIGGAGHSMARALEARGATLTEVEIDPVVVEVSDEFFGQLNGEVIVQDGRAYVEQAESGIYDYVLIDAFDGPASVPAQLTTLEFFQAVARVLKPDGRMIMNFIGSTSGPRSNSFFAVAASVAGAFTDARYSGGGNILLVGSQTPMTDLNFPAMPATGAPLTDDLNPIEIYLEEARSGFYLRR